MKYTAGFDKTRKKSLYGMFDEIIETEVWTQGPYTRKLEKMWKEITGVHAVAVSSWWGAAMCAMEYYGIDTDAVIIPANSFLGTANVFRSRQCELIFCDCRKDDLCASLESVTEKGDQYFGLWGLYPKAMILVHVGGHIAFDLTGITEYCQRNGILLFEDCAHSAGASWNKKPAGIWGEAGFYSFGQNSTMSTGEGGMLITKTEELANYARVFRQYGKGVIAKTDGIWVSGVDQTMVGGNYKMSEFTAALGIVQTKALDKMVRWKNEYAKKYLDPVHSKRIKFPDGMISSYYKYIVLERFKKSEGRVYSMPLHRLLNQHEDGLENTEWIMENHSCIPLYYRGDTK